MESRRRLDALDPTRIDKRRREYREFQMQYLYGITSKEYEKALENQQNRCAICDVEMGTPTIDHEHGTGRFRGLLCTTCNVGVGMFRDDSNLLSAAIAYLRR